MATCMVVASDVDSAVLLGHRPKYRIRKKVTAQISLGFEKQVDQARTLCERFDGIEDAPNHPRSSKLVLPFRDANDPWIPQTAASAHLI